MTASNYNDSPDKPEGCQGGKEPSDPDWANGLKRLYDSVLQEPLPEAFQDLLSKLDDSAKK